MGQAAFPNHIRETATRDSARQPLWPEFDPKRCQQRIGDGARFPSPWNSRGKVRVKLEMLEDCLIYSNLSSLDQSFKSGLIQSPTISTADIEPQYFTFDFWDSDPPMPAHDIISQLHIMLKCRSPSKAFCCDIGRRWNLLTQSQQLLFDR